MTQPWFLNQALTRFRSAVNTAYPNRDKTSDGTIGDAAHQTRPSDHNPDLDGSVDAWDMDVDLRSTNNAAAIERMKTVFQNHPSSSYWIHNRQIASRANGWRRDRYDGDNAHTMHVHWNTRQSHETSTAPWPIEGEEMALSEETQNVQAYRIEAIANMKPRFADVDVLPPSVRDQPVGLFLWADGVNKKIDAVKVAVDDIKELVETPVTVTLSPGDIAAIAQQVIDGLRRGVFRFEEDEMV